MTLHRLLALEMAFFLAGNSGPGRPAVLGVVAQAHRAHVNASAVSQGTTVYDGDEFSTEAGGMLRLRGGTAALDLAEKSELLVRSMGNGAQESAAELIKGTVVFSAEHQAAQIVARETRMRPAAEARTVAQVSVIGPKELRIYARRGSLQFSYRGESEMVAEGKSYRVILDPSGNDPKKKPKAFLFIIIGAELGVIGYEIWKELQSPDRP
jgi:hypothetical protein